MKSPAETESFYRAPGGGTPLPWKLLPVDKAEGRHTPLFEIHRSCRARMVDYSGWAMPVFYKGIRFEHQRIRIAAGIMDLSHLGLIEVTGEERENFLSTLLPFNISNMRPGRGKLALFLDERGKIEAEAVTWRLDGRLLLTTAAECREPLFDMLTEKKPGHGVTVTDLTGTFAVIGVLGRRSPMVLQRVTDMDLSHLPWRSAAEAFLGGTDALILRNSITGEDGFECVVAAGEAENTWDRLTRAGSGILFPVGIGAGETLRIEAGYHRFESELAGGISPIEAGLEKVIDFTHNFPGRDALMEKHASGTGRVPVGLVIESEAIPRAGSGIFTGRDEIGFITSSTLGPTVRKVIALGRIKAEKADPGTRLTVDSRGREYPAVVSRIPFYTNRRSLF